MPRKMPFRPGNEISQQYNDGLVKIYSVTDGAKPGYQPKAVLPDKPKFTLSFHERALGIKRLYLSRQSQAEVKRVIRVQRVNVSPQDVAITHDGRQYLVNTVQAVMGVYPPSLDLSLTALEQNFEVMPE